jgi:hypothetical protein
MVTLIPLTIEFSFIYKLVVSAVVEGLTGDEIFSRICHMIYDRLLTLIDQHLCDQITSEPTVFSSDEQLLVHISTEKQRFLLVGDRVNDFVMCYEYRWLREELELVEGHSVYSLHELRFHRIYIPTLERQTRLAVMATLKKTPSSVGQGLTRLMTGTWRFHGAWIRPVYLFTRPSAVSKPTIGASQACCMIPHGSANAYFPSILSHWSLQVCDINPAISSLQLERQAHQKTTPITCELDVIEGVNLPLIQPARDLVLGINPLPAEGTLLGYTTFYNHEISSIGMFFASITYSLLFFAVSHKREGKRQREPKLTYYLKPRWF